MSMFTRHLAVRMISQVLGPDWDVAVDEDYVKLYYTVRVGQRTMIAAEIFTEVNDVIEFIADVLEAQ